jgi:hypothetical protein
VRGGRLCLAFPSRFPAAPVRVTPPLFLSFLFIHTRTHALHRFLLHCHPGVLDPVTLLSYAVNIYDEGRTVSIVTDAGGGALSFLCALCIGAMPPPPPLWS